MANNEIKQKIVLDGEQQYRQALKDAQRNLKTLRSELKAETAELGKNASEQQKAEAKTKNLQKQIKEQEQVVKTLRQALAECKEKYGDNEDAVQKWEQKLNDARTTLANMKNELEGVADGFKDVESSADMATVASHSIAESLESLGDIGEKISSGIETAFSGLLSSVKETVTAIWGEIVDIAARSNNIVDLAGFWNTDATTIQKYAGAVEYISGNLSDLSSIVTKINSMDSKKIAELTGVSGENYEDRWEYAMAVMDAMSKMPTSQRNEAGFGIFGKGATKAFDLLNDWEKMQEHLSDFSPTGYGLSEEELQKMSDLYDQVNGIKASWEYLQQKFQVKLFGDIALDLTGNAQAILDAFLKYFNAEDDAEREAALKEIEENIKAIFERIKKAIEDGIALIRRIADDLKSSDDQAVQSIGALFDGLANALEWFTEDNMKNVVGALEMLLAFWTGAKIATMIANIAAFASHLSTLVGAHGVGAAASGAAAGSSWGTAFAGAVMKAAPWLIGLYTLLKPADTASDDLDSLFDEKGNPTQAAKDAGINMTEEQFNAQTQQFHHEDAEENALQQMWDKYRSGKLTQKDIDNFGEVVLSDSRTMEYLKAIREFQAANPDWREIEDLPSDFFQMMDKWEEITEDVDLDASPEYSAEDKAAAIQDWWDALKNADKGEADYDEADRALEWMKEVLGDDFGATWDSINEHLDELGEKQWKLEDLPADWWTEQGKVSDASQEMKDSAKDIASVLNGLPKDITAAMGNVAIYMNGEKVAAIVTPYVSQNLASDMYLDVN